jgi:hypothetical protein
MKGCQSQQSGLDWFVWDALSCIIAEVMPAAHRPTENNSNEVVWKQWCEYVVCVFTSLHAQPRLRYNFVTVTVCVQVNWPSEKDGPHPGAG